MRNKKTKANGSVNGNGHSNGDVLEKTKSPRQAKSKSAKAGPVKEVFKTTTSGNGNGHHEEIDMRALLYVLNEVKNGNFSVRMPIDQVGVSGKICDTLNEIIL